MTKYIYDTRLVGKHSCFDQKLFEKYDIPARDAVKKALGEFVKDNPNIKKQDLVITDPTYKYKYIELQVCSSWVSDRFPFDNVYIYERKGCYGNDTLFMTLDKHLTSGYIFDAESIKDKEPRRIKKYAREFVYDIPWNRIMPFNIDDLTPDLVKMY